MSDDPTEQEVYDQVGVAWRESGLGNDRVMGTLGWERAVDSVHLLIEQRGRPWMTMGPTAGDSWWNWLHILTHSNEDGHSLAHAKFELQLTNLVIATLSLRENPS